MRRSVCSINPYGITACYAIFILARAEDNVKSFAEPTTLDGPIHELILPNVDEAPLHSQLSCGDICETAVLQHGIDNDVSYQRSQHKEELSPLSTVTDRGESSGEPWCRQQQTWTSTPGPSSTAKDKQFHSVFNVLPVLVPTSGHVRNEVCRKHSLIFMQELKRHKLWALQMYDSSAKLPSSILRGNANQLGDFDQCLAVTSQDEAHIDGKYCLASVDVKATKLVTKDIEPLQEAVQRALAYEFIKSTYRDPGHFIPRFTTIKWAICVPASCSASDVHQTLLEALHSYNETTGLIFDVHVDPEMCYVKHETGKPLGTATVLTLAFFGAVMVIAAVATFKDTRHKVPQERKEGQLERVIMAFSVRKNMRELLAELPAEGDINCIYGVRALCTIAVYLAHKVIVFGFSPYFNRIKLTEISNERWTAMFRASVVYTDSFLFLSGVLTSFNMSKELERKKRIDWIKKHTARFIRLTPALLAVVLFYAHLLEHLGSGPQWNLAVKRNADICKENLWKNILYIQNFFPFEQMCAIHTHQLALDMQLSILSPLLVTLLWQWRVCGVVVLLCLNALTALLRYVTAFRNQLSLFIYHGMTVQQLYETANLMYSQSLHRATPYVQGIALGYLLRKPVRYSHIPKIFLWAGWTLASYFAYLSVFSPSDMGLRDYSYDVNDASIYAAFSPIIWSLALSWVIWACFTGHGGLLNDLLCCRSFIILSRISYSVYLTQFAFFFYKVGSIRATEQFSLSTIVNVAELLTLLVSSIFVTLLFDLPMQEVKGILIDGGSRHGKAP